MWRSHHLERAVGAEAKSVADCRVASTTDPATAGDDCRRSDEPTRRDKRTGLRRAADNRHVVLVGEVIPLRGSTEKRHSARRTLANPRPAEPVTAGVPPPEQPAATNEDENLRSPSKLCTHMPNDPGETDRPCSGSASGRSKVELALLGGVSEPRASS